MAVFDLFGLLGSKWQSNHFYSERPDTGLKENVWKLFCITIFPFVLDIYDLIINTINLGLGADNALRLISNLKFYNAFSAYWSLSWLICVGLYVFKNQHLFVENNEKLIQSNIVFLMLYIFIKKFVDHSLREVIAWFPKQPLISGLNNFVSFLNLGFVCLCVWNYGFIKNIISNAYNKICSDNGFYNDQGKWVVSYRGRKNKEKITSMCWYLSICLFISLISATVIKIAGDNLEKLIKGSATSVSGGGQNQAEITDNLKKKDPKDMMMLILQILVIAPIYEELFFRHTIVKLNNYSYPSIFLSSIIFSLVHTRSGETIFTLLSYISAAVTFTLVYRKNRNILFTMILHALHNSLALISFFIIGNK